ncbi:hypothetical protein SLA2020_009700 [Shorea laevis]
MSRAHFSTVDTSSRLLYFFKFMMILLLPLLSHSTDPDLLQDFCAGDLAAAAAAAAPSRNGFPCKPTSAVTSDGFFFDALTKEGNMSNISGSAVNPANVLIRSRC